MHLQSATGYRIGPTHLYKVFPPIPFKGCSEVLAVKSNVIESTKTFLIAAQDDLVLSSFFNAHSVVGVTVCWMEVENKE